MLSGFIYSPRQTISSIGKGKSKAGTDTSEHEWYCRSVVAFLMPFFKMCSDLVWDYECVGCSSSSSSGRSIADRSRRWWSWWTRRMSNLRRQTSRSCPPSSLPSLHVTWQYVGHVRRILISLGRRVWSHWADKQIRLTLFSKCSTGKERERRGREHYGCIMAAH